MRLPPLALSFVPDPHSSEALDELQLKRYCCRRMVLTHVDLIEKLLHYNRERFPCQLNHPNVRSNSHPTSDGTGEGKSKLLNTCSCPFTRVLTGIYLSNPTMCCVACRCAAISLAIQYSDFVMRPSKKFEPRLREWPLIPSLISCQAKESR